MVGKSAIRDIVKSFIDEHPSDKTLMDRSRIFIDRAMAPKKGFDIRNVIWHMATNTASNGTEYANNEMHILVDSLQWLEKISSRADFLHNRGVPGLSNKFYPSESVTMEQAVARGTRASTKIFEEDLSASGFNTCIQICAYDNSSAVSSAKLPEQMERRRQRLEQLSKKNERVVLEADPEWHKPTISLSDAIPSDWRARTSWSQYRQAIVDMLIEHAMDEKHGVKFDSAKGQMFAVWRRGRMMYMKPNSDAGGGDRIYEASSSSASSSSNYDGPSRVLVDDEMTKLYSMMGEYDYFVMRYVLNTVIDTIDLRLKDMDIDGEDDTMSPDQKNNVYDMRNIVFRLHTTDTDLLLYSLWTLEYIKHKFKMRSTQLPQIHIVSKTASSNKISYKVTDTAALFIALEAKLATMHNDTNFVIRSMCTAFIFWGGDLMPSCHSITPQHYMTAYVHLNPCIGLPILTPTTDKDGEHPYSCSINGEALEALFYMAYAVAIFWARDLKKLEGGALQDKYDEIISQVLEFPTFNDFIVELLRLCNGSKRKRGEKNPMRKTKRALSIENQPPEPKYGVCQARISLLTYSLLCLEHALDCIDGSEYPLRQIGLIQVYPNAPYYVNVYEQEMQILTPRERYVAKKIGLLSYDRCYRWSDPILMKGNNPNIAHIPVERRLGKVAARVFWWPELDDANQDYSIEE